MDRVFEAALFIVVVGGVALAKLGLLDDAARWLKADPPERHMAATNPWSKDYDPKAAEAARVRQASVFYPNCAAARAAGAAPLKHGQPGYRGALDRDGDGIACEPYNPR